MHTFAQCHSLAAELPERNYLPVQILPDLVVAMERQGFTPAEVKGGYGYRPKEEGAEDNPLLVVGVHTKDIVYDR